MCVKLFFECGQVGTVTNVFWEERVPEGRGSKRKTSVTHRSRAWPCMTWIRAEAVGRVVVENVGKAV